MTVKELIEKIEKGEDLGNYEKELSKDILKEIESKDPKLIIRILERTDNVLLKRRILLM